VKLMEEKEKWTENRAEGCQLLWQRGVQGRQLSLSELLGLICPVNSPFQCVQARRGKRMTKEEAIYGYEDSDIEDEGRGRRGKKVR